MAQLSAELFVASWLALTIVTSAGGEPPAPAARGETDLYGDPLPKGSVARLGTTRWRHAGTVNALAASSDGKTLATITWERLVRLSDMRSGRQLRRLAVEDSWPEYLTFSPDGNTLAVGCSDGVVRLWDVSLGKQIRRLGNHKAKVFAIVFLPDGKSLVSAAFSDMDTVLSSGGKFRTIHSAEDKTVRLWDVHTGQVIRTFTGHEDGVVALALSPDGKTLASASPDKTIRVWDVASGRELRRLNTGKDGRDVALAFLCDGRTLVWLSGDDTFHFWDTLSGREIRQLTTAQPNRAPFFFRQGGAWALSHDGKTLALTEGDKIRRFDPATGQEQEPLSLAIPIHAFAFTADDRGVIIADRHKIGIIDSNTGAPVPGPAGHATSVAKVSFAQNDEVVVSVSEGGEEACCWNGTTGKRIAELGPTGRSGWGRPFALSPDGRSLITVDFEGQAQVWDTFRAKNNRQITLEDAKGTSFIEFLADGHRLAVVSQRREVSLQQNLAEYHDRDTVHVVDLADGKRKVFLAQEQKSVGRFPHNDNLNAQALALAPDGNSLVLKVMSDKRPMRTWDVLTRAECRKFRDTNIHGRTLAFSADGRLLATARQSRDDRNSYSESPGDPAGAICLWEFTAEQQVAQFEGCSTGVQALAFSPDGRLFAAGGQDGLIHVWDLLAERELATLRGHDGEVNALAFSSNCRLLASGSADTTILVWDVAGIRGQLSVSRSVLSSTDLERLWKELLDPSARRAHLAEARLIQAPEQAVDLLEARLRPLAGSLTRDIGLQLSNLDSNQFEVRVQARRRLEALGALAEPFLREALERGPNAEVSRSVEGLLDPARVPKQASENLRLLRALSVLETIGSSQARRALGTLAEGGTLMPGLPMAKACLQRLAKRPLGAR